MTPDEFAERMAPIAKGAWDSQANWFVAHEDADRLLVQLIRENLPGFSEGLAAYESFDKWYS
jgi:hypothetical protein